MCGHHRRPTSCQFLRKSSRSRWGLTPESYLRGGHIDAERMLELLASLDTPVESVSRVLDFGCAEGRVLRFLPRSPEAELWEST